MNKILLNICLVIVTIAVVYTILTLPATINQTIRTETDEMLTSLKSDITASVNTKMDTMSAEVTSKIVTQAKSELQKYLPENVTDEQLNQYVSGLASKIIKENYDLKINEDMLIDALKQALKESLTQVQ